MDGLTLKVKTAGEQQGAAWNKAEASARTLEKSSQSLGGRLMETAAGVAGGMAAYAGFNGILGTITGAIRSTIGAGIDFGDMMNTLQAVSGATKDQLAQLQQKAIDLGNDLTLPNTSASDAARAMTELSKAGLSVTDTMAAAKGTLQLAAAAGTDEASAAELAANALNAFHLAGSQAGKVADLLAASANASAADIGEMGFALQQSSASAAQLGIPIENLITMLAEMANAGIKGSDAGTSVKTMLAALTPNSAAAAAAMKQLGVSAFDVHGNMRPIPAIIDQYSKALAKLTPQQRQMAIETIFGSDASRAANIILGQGVAAFDKLEGAVTKAGAAQDVASAKSKGLGGALRALQSEAETMSLQLYQRMEPALESAAKWAGDALPAAFDQAGRWMRQLLPPIQDLIGDFGRLFGAAGGAQGVLGKIGDLVVAVLVPALRTLHAIFPLLEAAVITLTARWLALNVVMAATAAIGIVTFLAELATQLYIAASAEGVLTAAQWLLNIAMDANPIGLIALAIGALISVIVLAIIYWKQITQALHAFWGKVQEVSATISRFIEQHKALAVVIAIVGGPVYALIGAFSLLVTHWNELVAKGREVLGILGGLWNSLRAGADPVRAVARTLGDLLLTFGVGKDRVATFEKAFVKMGDSVVAAAQRAAAPIDAVRKAITEPIRALVTAPSSPAAAAAAAAGTVAAGKGAAPAKAPARGAQSPAGAFFSELGTKVHELPALLGRGANAVERFLERVGAKLMQGVQAVGQFFSQIGGAAARGWAAFAQHPIYWIGYVVGYVPVKLFMLLNQFAGWVDQMIARAAAWSGQMIQHAVTAATNFVEAARRELAALPGRVQAWLSAVIPQVGAWASQMAANAMQAARDFGAAIKGEFDKLPSQMVQLGKNIAQGVIDGIKSLATNAKTAMGSFVQGLIDGAKAAAGNPHSPAPATIPLGKSLSEGVQEGVLRGAPGAHSAMAGLIGAITSIGAARGAGGIVTRPVLSGSTTLAGSPLSIGSTGGGARPMRMDDTNELLRQQNQTLAAILAAVKPQPFSTRAYSG